MKALLLALGVICAPAAAQPSPSSEKPVLLILGTNHFANPGRDAVNSEMDDVLAPKRQAEIEALVKTLARFKPTRIAVEMSIARQDALDERYKAYREGRYQLGRGEADQIGLRLAAAMGLQKVYAADWNGMPPGDIALYDWDQYGKANGHAAAIEALSKPSGFGLIPQQGHTISSWLKAANAPDMLAANHRVYFDIAAIGDGDVQPGATWVGHWYARNLRIFGKLKQIAQHPEDRLLVIYGLGHAYLLNQFARESGAFRVVAPAAYLGN